MSMPVPPYTFLFFKASEAFPYIVHWLMTVKFDLVYF